MKCNKCGFDIPEDFKFCPECGTPVPENKICPNCNREVPLKMKFCGYCGYKFEGKNTDNHNASLNMGDKNVIAGDVIGKKEEYKISGNATIIKNEDETKKVIQCYVCGKHVTNLEVHTCPNCGNSVCKSCYDKELGMCISCKGDIKEYSENKYREALQKAYEDGKVDLDERRSLKALQKRLGLSDSKVQELENKIKKSSNNTDSFTTVESIKLEEAAELFFDKYNPSEAYELIKPLYYKHKCNEKVLGIYLPILAEIDSDKAINLINNLQADMLTAYLVKIDIYLNKDLSETEKIINKAEKLWEHNFSIKCARALLLYRLYEETERETFYDDFIDNLDSLGAPSTKYEAMWKKKCTDIVDSIEAEERYQQEEAERIRKEAKKRKEEEAKRANEARLQREEKERRSAEKERIRKAEEEKQKKLTEERKRKDREAERKANKELIKKILEEELESLKFFNEAQKNPVVLPKGTDGTVGKDGTYILFGVWPQSFKEYDVTIDESKTYKVNAWDCYKGSDGYYYVKETRNMEKIRNKTRDRTRNNRKESQEYYFRLAPIKWRILTDKYQNGNLLLSERILTTRVFYYSDSQIEESQSKKNHLNNYEFSDIRKWLNNDFFMKAFSNDAQNIINTVTVSNGSKSFITSEDGKLSMLLDFLDGPKYASHNTQDKIFLLSKKEVLDENYGFDTDNFRDKARERLCTDYSLTRYSSLGIHLQRYHNADWMLRSPGRGCGGFNDSDICVVTDHGFVYEEVSSDNNIGIVPALSLNSKKM